MLLSAPDVRFQLCRHVAFWPHHSLQPDLSAAIRRTLAIRCANAHPLNLQLTACRRRSSLHNVISPYAAVDKTVHVLK